MIALERGYIFCTSNPMAIGKAINFVQKLKSIDNESEYGHSGIIVDSDGSTFEALWKIRFNHIDRYIGQKVLIGKLVYSNNYQLDSAIKEVINDHKGQWYPLWRLGLHMTPLAKWINFSHIPVCSELVAKMLVLAGVAGIGKWSGKNPDHIADMIHKWRVFEVVYEGIWEGIV